MGVGTLITGIAPAIGPTFGGTVTTYLSWRYIFVFLIPVLLVSLVLGISCIQQKQPLQPSKLDVISVMLLIVAFSGLIFGASEFSSADISHFVAWIAFVVGALALIAFILRARRQPQPILDLTPFAHASFSQHAFDVLKFKMKAYDLSCT